MLQARGKYWNAGFDGRPIREEYLIVEGGHLAGAGAHSYSTGNATGGWEEATRYRAGARM